MYNVRTFFVPEEGNIKVVTNFKVSEFACKDGTPAVFVSMALADTLQAIRDKVKQPIIINSGFRTYSHNKQVGGETYSLHMQGMAADIQCPNVSFATLKAAVNSVMGQTGGVGIYKNFIHVDVRNGYARWNDNK